MPRPVKATGNPPLPDGRRTPTRQGHTQKVGCLKEA